MSQRCESQAEQPQSDGVAHPDPQLEPQLHESVVHEPLLYDAPACRRKPIS